MDPISVLLGILGTRGREIILVKGHGINEHPRYVTRDKKYDAATRTNVATDIAVGETGVTNSNVLLLSLLLK
jgi:hypothetical protein